MAASLLHQTIVETLRAAPSLVLALLRVVRTDVPADVEAAGVSASFSPVIDDLHVDGAIELRDASGLVDRVVVVDVQLARLDQKLFTLPVYQALARRRHRVPCEVLALDPRATAMPAEMAFLRALVVGRERPAEIVEAAAVFDDLPQEAGMLYLDLILRTLPHAVRMAVETLMQLQRFEPKSRLIRSFIEKGREEGREEGRELFRGTIRAVLAARGIPIEPADEERLSACRDQTTLMKWATRAATATGRADVFDVDQGVCDE